MDSKIIDRASKVSDALRGLSEGDSLKVIALALEQRNYMKPEADRTLTSSCGCFDWNTSMDYRKATDR